jgi:hypothetical protein
VDFTNGEFSQNLQRADNLIRASRAIENSNFDDDQLSKDVLRAAVVFLHSSLEEVIRNLYTHRVWDISAEHLNNIPFLDHDSSHRAKPFSLGDLKNHKGRFVDTIITSSLEKYLDTSTTNNSAQLIEHLKRVNIDHAPFSDFYASLDSLMKRRHQIVHQMDRINVLDPQKDPVTDIDLVTVMNWRNTLNNFFGTLIGIVPPNNEPARSKRRRRKAS